MEGVASAACLLVISWINNVDNLINRRRDNYLKFFFASSFLFEWHAFLVFLEIFTFGRLKVEPGVGKGFHMRKQGLNEWMKLILPKYKIQNYQCYQCFHIISKGNVGWRRDSNTTTHALTLELNWIDNGSWQLIDFISETRTDGKTTEDADVKVGQRSAVT